jgi:hypothetical protein
MTKKRISVLQQSAMLFLLVLSLIASVWPLRYGE